MAVIYLTDPSVTSFVVPADWNSADNSIECIGAGAGGKTPVNLSSEHSGGGGGAYARKNNARSIPETLSRSRSAWAV
jgi:hypothetical protein